MGTMRRVSSKACPLVVRTGCVLAASASVAAAQSIEPRAYSNAPVGVNFLLAGPYYTRGGLSFDTALPVTDPQLKTSNLVLGYARTLDLWGKSGKFDAIVPYTWLSGSASYRGEAVEREVDGFADPLFRLSVNFYVDNFLIMADSQEEAVSMLSALGDALAHHPAGPFSGKIKARYSPGDTVEFLGYAITPAPVGCLGGADEKSSKES